MEAEKGTYEITVQLLMTADRVLQAFAAMAPSRSPTARSIASGDLLWLGQALDRTAVAAPGGVTPRNSLGDELLKPVSPFQQVSMLHGFVVSPAQVWNVDVLDAGGNPRADGREALRALQAAAKVAGPEVPPRLAWVVLAGNTTGPHGSRRVLAPLLTCQVGLGSNPAITRGLGLGGPRPDAIGEWELTQRSDWGLGFEPADPERAAALVDQPVFWADVPHTTMTPAQHHDELVTWIAALAAEDGLVIDRISRDHPALHEDEDGITACLGWALLPPGRVARFSAGASLAAWASVPGIEGTCFARIVDPHDAAAGGGSATEAAEPEVESHLPLTLAQRRVLLAARHEPVTVVSGAPGTGKSHLVAAIAADAAGRGMSVLIATRSIEAADVLADLLRREPGPVPLRFGSPAARQSALAEIERRLAERSVSGASRLLDQAREHRDSLRDRVATLLDRVGAAARWEHERALVARHREAVPGFFTEGVDLDRVAADIDLLKERPRGWRAWRARRRLRRIGRSSDLPALLEAARAALLQRDAHHADGAVAEIEELWSPLAAAEADLRHWVGRVMDDVAIERAGSSAGRRALSALHAALRAGPSSRQRLLSAIPDDDLVQVAPLWLGTLGEVDELLPRDPGLFELVILDEASQIDQPSAAPALLRGRRGVIVGDPRQLRHVSFVADDAQAKAFAEAGLSDTARLDVRRNSILDVAAGVSPVRWLNEHHRSVPHLIGFSLERFYDGAVTLATRHPRNESTDAIEVVGTGGDPLATVLSLIEDLDAGGSVNVGVVTPFRELADSLSAALRVGDAALERIDHLDLRVGTVHEFQGSERDVMIIVPGLEETDNGSRRAFVVDPHLFNVMVTRARRRVVVVTDLPPGDGDLLAEYLRWAAVGPRPVGGAAPPTRLAAQLDAALRDSGVPTRCGYPVGQWTVDICAGTGDDAVGLICGLHPDGAAVHIERHLTLRERGWKLVDPAVAGSSGVAERGIELSRLLKGHG